jgi:hypothetical protein
MCIAKIRSLWLGLGLIGLSCLNSCATEHYDWCPVYPVAGAKVAEDISGLESEAFWEWLGRINQLRQQLELCQQREAGK